MILKTLTKELLQIKSNSKDYKKIKYLNLWGHGFQNIDLIKNLENLEILTISSNEISSLKFVKNLKNLKELNARENKINNIEEIEYLRDLKNLKILNLSGNPVCMKKNFKKNLLLKFSNLEVLNGLFVNKKKIKVFEEKLYERTCDYNFEKMIKKKKNLEICKSYLFKIKKKKNLNDFFEVKKKNFENDDFFEFEKKTEKKINSEITYCENIRKMDNIKKDFRLNINHNKNLIIIYQFIEKLDNNDLDIISYECDKILRKRAKKSI